MPGYRRAAPVCSGRAGSIPAASIDGATSASAPERRLSDAFAFSAVPQYARCGGHPRRGAIGDCTIAQRHL